MIEANTAVNTSNNGLGNRQSTTSLNTLSSNYQDFLRLLTTQLQNQDPTEPTDTNQLTQQIATLSQVEQQINTNKNLEQLIAMFNATQYNSVVSYIGKVVEAIGNAGALENGSAMFSYYLATDAATTATITVKNATGTVVYSGPATTLKGRNEFIWDGKNNQGVDQPSGTYTFEISAKDSSNNDVISQTYTAGIVTSIDSVGGQVYLSFGDIALPITSVVSIRQPAPPAPPIT